MLGVQVFSNKSNCRTVILKQVFTMTMFMKIKHSVAATVIFPRYMRRFNHWDMPKEEEKLLGAGFF
jgi:hypothetical protein